MDLLEPLVRSFQADGRPRVWSLVITVFGDCILSRGGRVPSARLRLLLARIGIGDGALRTALSRLVADGWLLRERDGRNTLYRLTERGVAEARRASTLIYAPPRNGPVERWQFWLGGDAPPSRSLSIGAARAWPEDEPAPAPEGAIAAGCLLSVPDSMKAAVASDRQRTEAERLDADLAHLERLLDEGGPGAPLDALSARILLVHRWRRYILRFVDVPDELAPAGWRGANLRPRVARAWHALFPLSEAWLDAELAGAPAMPVADMLQKRF